MRAISLSGACVIAGVGCAAWAAGCSSSQSTGGSGGSDAADDGTGGSDDGTSPSGDATNPSEGSTGSDGGRADAPADVAAEASETSVSTDASDASSASDSTQGDGPNNDAADGASPYHAYCAAYIAAACGGNPSTVSACEGFLGSSSSCAALNTCIACAGASPVATCNDAGGPPHIAGCASCENLQCSSGDGGGGGDGGDASVGCPGVQTFSGAGSPDPWNPTPIPSGSLSQPIAILGPALPGSGGYGELGGFFEVTGLTPNGVVSASMIMYPCGSGAACPSDINFAFGAFDGGGGFNLQSTSGACDSAPFAADSNGNLFIQVGKNGDSGAENNFGLELRSPPSTDAGPTDAPSGG